MLMTTLSEIRRHRPCEDGFAKVRDHLGVSASDAKTHAEPFPVALLLETNGIWDALWVFDRVAPGWMRDAFLIRRLDTSEHSALQSLRLNPVDADWWRDCEAAIVRVVALLHRRMAGEGVAAEMAAAANAAARAAANAAACAAYAAYAAANAAAAAAYAAADAAYAADNAADNAAEAAAYAAADAAYAARAAGAVAAYAAADAARAARAAADAAARADLIAALEMETPQ